MSPARYRLGCVSFLNAKPLVEGLDQNEQIQLRYDVPSRLLEDLLREQVDAALCPVIDYQTADQPLCIIPAGGIGCDGPTMTVRLYSRVPLEQVRRVHTDTDSHTSIALLQVLMHDGHGIDVEICDLKPGDRPDSMLLIGDKVVTAAPDESDYIHRLDLGEAWKQLTGLPFVFAIWMARRKTDLGLLPEWLAQARQRGTGRIDAIVARHAEPLGWPVDRATEYLGSLLKYEIGPPQLTAIEAFWSRSAALGLCPAPRPLELARPPAAC